VFAAEILHGLSAGILTPAIAAISLGLVGRRAMSVRTGRNYRFDAAGNALTAGLMGLAGHYFAKSAIFLGSAALCIPALIALARIRADEIDYARARNAGKGEKAKSYRRLFDLGRNPKLYIFAACVFLFQFADASMLPVVGENLAQSRAGTASLLMASLIVVPQIVVAAASPWIGYHSEKCGRKPLLLLGFGLEIARGLLFAFSADVAVLASHRSIARRHQRGRRHGAYHPGCHGPDHRHRPLQSRARVHRDSDSHCRLDQHHGDRFYVPSTRALGGLLDSGRNRRHCDGFTVGRHARDKAGRVSRLASRF
jgi:hypothetical protein